MKKLLFKRVENILAKGAIPHNVFSKLSAAEMSKCVYVGKDLH